jgi:hypothetical protein
MVVFLSLVKSRSLAIAAHFPATALGAQRPLTTVQKGLQVLLRNSESWFSGAGLAAQLLGSQLAGIDPVQNGARMDLQKLGHLGQLHQTADAWHYNLTKF